MGGTCEAPTELYARDTDGRGADTHSPFLSLPHAYPSLVPGRIGKKRAGRKAIREPLRVRGRKKKKPAEKAVNI